MLVSGKLRWKDSEDSKKKASETIPQTVQKMAPTGTRACSGRDRVRRTRSRVLESRGRWFPTLDVSPVMIFFGHVGPDRRAARLVRRAAAGGGKTAGKALSHVLAAAWASGRGFRATRDDAPERPRLRRRPMRTWC